MRKNIIPITITTTVLSAIIFNLSISTIYSSANVSAVSYQSSNNIEFNLNPTISISTSGNLSIESLTPGNYNDSNTISVTASSNALAGYTLTSTVGTTGNLSNELRKDGTDTANKFTNLSSNISSLSSFSDNQWGYSYSTDNGSTWISGDIDSSSTGYNGYTYNTSTSTSGTVTHLDTSTPSSTTIQYKIGAKASTTQLAGNYTNTINFTAVAKPNLPIIYMQNATLADCGQSMVDIRDNNVYPTTLVGGACWMTKNLDLAGNTILSSDDTDFTSDYYANLPNTNGWTKVDKNRLRVPASSTMGFNSDNHAYVYNSNSTTCAENSPCYSYYSWDTATVGSGRTISDDNTDAPYSICPKGWHLPNTRTGTNDTSDFRVLMIILGGTADISSYDQTTIPIGATVFSNLSAPPLNFLRAGYYSNSVFNVGGVHGRYWSNTSYSEAYARYLGFSSVYVYSAGGDVRKNGFSVRCLLDS